MLLDKIKALAAQHQADNIATRRHLHAHPELSYQEFETSKYVQARLTEIGIPFTVIATTGVLGIIEGKNPTKRVIALRADMDALPIIEENTIDYKSTNEGVMHACGHDVHTTILLGAAKVLWTLRDEFEGTIKLLFQPGEEKNPGGASYMIRDGALENPKPQGIVGLHVHPGLNEGKLSFRKGRVMASADELYVSIKGPGGHAATPHQTVDTILVAAQLIQSLQTIISRNRNPQNPSKRVIALRADMDALPIIEENKIDYKSNNDGVMHACGHDVHTTILLGAAKILWSLREEFEGTIKLLFQPGEEKNPGGATYMIRDGALENPKPQGIVGLHVHPGLNEGKLSFRKGRVMASADELYISIKGPGGHAATPHQTVDTILVAAQLIQSLQTIIARNRNPQNPSVLSICSIHGGNTTNVIPSEVKLMGTFRAMDEVWRFQAHDLMLQQAKGIAIATGAEIDFRVDVGYPTVDNEPILTEAAWRLADAYMGKENVEETEKRMGAEDFGYYSQVIPGCFFRLGVRNESAGIVHNVHTPHFNIDEAAIEQGVGMMAWLGTQL